MKCKRCKRGNSYKANYCYRCGREFRKLEKETAVKSGFVAFLKQVRDGYDTITLSHITGTWQFRLISILIVLFIGIFGIVKNGTHLKILNSDIYSFQYNDVENEYYIYTKEDKMKLNIYSLGKKNSIKVRHFNNEELLSEEEFSDFSNLIVTSSYNDDFYILDYKNDSLKMYIYKIDD